MEGDVRRLHRWSWLFIGAGTLRALVVPIAGAVFVSGGDLAGRLDLLSLLVVLPAWGYGLIRQRVYTYRFTQSELIVRDGLLTRNVRHIAYERIHNVSLVRNPIHRLFGVTTAQIETAAGGKPEASLRVVSLQAAQDLRRYTLGEGEGHASRESEPLGVGSTDPASNSRSEGGEIGPSLLRVPDRELLRLGLISNRGLIVAAAVLGVGSQIQWWEQDWFKNQDWAAIYLDIRAKAPDWAGWLFDPGALVGKALLFVAVLLLLAVALRVFSMAWYLVRYRGFTLQRTREGLRARYGLWPEVSSLIPVHRIQLVTVNETLLHRWFERASIDIETAGANDTNSGMGSASGNASTRHWLAPIVESGRAHELVREVLPEIDMATVEWRPIEARAARRIVNRIAIALMPVTLGVGALFALTPIPLSGWQALWLPLVLLPTAWIVARQWVRHAGFALSDRAILFRSGWVSRQVSAVRYSNAQIFWMRQSPFDRRRRMASVAVDTAGAGNLGHRIDIPFLDVDVAEEILRRLYEETRGMEFRW